MQGTLTSPPSPGQSWYEADYAQNSHTRPTFAKLDQNITCDVAIIGGGFTGLSCAWHLSQFGINTVLVDGAHFGDGASGRNGGQIGTGQRQWAEDLEKHYGFTRAKALFDLSEQAKQNLLHFANHHDIDFKQGHLSVAHKKRFVKTYRHHQENMRRFGYKQLAFMDDKEASERLGSKRYYGGLRDHGTGHINPLKLVIALAKEAENTGAHLYENTSALRLERKAKGFIIETAQGTITAERVVLASNAYGPMLDPHIKSHIIPIRSYIGTTPPLPENTSILPGFESVDDSRFVVRYFKKTPDNCLLFGGAESYTDTIPQNVDAKVIAQILEVYPQLKNTKLSHVWGGTVAITVERMPYIRELSPGLIYSGGYSGHGVMLAPYMGRLIADHLVHQGEDWAIMEDLKISPFPGGKFLRNGLLFLGMNWFALNDKF